MKSILILILITSITLVSGCTEIFSSVSSSGKSIPEDVFSHYAEIDHSVSTLWTKSVLIFETESKTQPGFYYDFPTEGATSYIVSGTIKNIATVPLNSIALTINFKDSLGNTLRTFTQTYKDIYAGSYQNFEFKMPESETYFDHVSDYDITIKSIKIPQEE